MALASRLARSQTQITAANTERLGLAKESAGKIEAQIRVAEVTATNRIE